MNGRTGSPQAWSDYIVYVDESGDHGLASMDPAYPLFVLAFCIFDKRTLSDSVVPAVLRFKFEQFGHDQVVLHEHEIRKAKGTFRFLVNAERRERFMISLNEVVAATSFTVVAVVIRKDALVGRYSEPQNPYVLAMEFGLERVCRFLGEHGQRGRLTHCVFERRGAKEDQELELEFRRVTDGASAAWSQASLDIIMADKKSISTGLQLADLVARPIGLHVLRPSQANRAYGLVEPKLRRGPGGQILGYGLKVFP